MPCLTAPQVRYNMNSSKYSNFYLERVGFEINSKLKKELKNGRNVIGRNDVADNDIGLESLHCSRRHCAITVSEDSVEVEDMGSSNGTTVNGIKRKDKVSLQEGDIIGIVGGLNPVSAMKGNFNYIVYRLRKYDNENIQIFEIDDDDPIELSDDDNDVICLSESDGEVDSKGDDDDLAIHLSRMFNIEIKKELEAIDEIEMELKSEPAEYSDMDEFIVERIVDCNDDQEFDSHLESENALGESNHIPSDCESNDSNDSNRTLYFPPLGGCNDQCNVSTNASTSKRSQKHRNDESVDKKLKETVTKLNGNLKRKEGPKIIDPKPLEKRLKTKTKTETTSPNGKLKKKTKNESKFKVKKKANDEKKENKEKLKNVGSVIPKSPVDVKSKTPTKPKVKFTPHNRSKFLTDLTQAPVLPRYVKVKPKGKGVADNEGVAVESEQQFSKNVTDNGFEGFRGFSSVDTPLELEQEINKNMSSPQKIVQNGYKSTPKIIDDFGVETPGHEQHMEVDDSGVEDPYQDENMVGFADQRGDGDEVEDEDEQEEEEEDYDEDEFDVVQCIMNLPPETGVVRVIETEPRPANLKSILVPPGRVKPIEVTPKRRVTFYQSDFQFNPRHQIISQLTSYDAAKFGKLDVFWRNVDTNVTAFVDIYEDYTTYRGTVVPLMMVELWKEIEMEYSYSLDDPFTTVTVTDVNIEKRGEGRRLVFHCQGDSLYKSKSISDGHLVVARCEYVGNKIEFLAFIETISYSTKLAKQKIAYFTMETAGLTEIVPKEVISNKLIKVLQIRPITVITNTLNVFHAIYNLKYSPLTPLVLNPLLVQTHFPSQYTTDVISYKGCDPLDCNQLKILNTLYKRCTKLTEPNISLVNGAAGTGKSHLIVNLALQLVYGDDLLKPLRILICSKTNGSVDEITTKLMKIRDKTCANQKINLVRFGFLEHMCSAVKQVSVQHLKDNEQFSPQYNSYDELVQQKDTLELKIRALTLDDDMDHTHELELLNKQLFKFDALLDRFKDLDKKKLRDATTFILNSCDIICTTLGSISKLQSYVRNVDVCIVDEATECNEPLTILPFNFGMPSLVLVGDSELLPATAFSPVVRELKYGSSLFARFQKLYLGKFGTPVFNLNFQYRMHEEIMKWPNTYFYKNCVVPHPLVRNNSTFPIVPYKLISYDLHKGESDSIIIIIKFLLEQVDKNVTIGVITTNYKQNSVMQNKLRDYPFITTHSADSYIAEKDIIIIWISKEHGMASLGHPQTLNTALTRAKKSLVICGTELTSYKKKPVWRLLLEDAIKRKCLQRCKTLTEPKIHTFLKK